MDHDYKVTAAAIGFTIDKTKGDDLARFPIEKARLRSIWYFVSISTACTIGYGWTLQAKAVSRFARPLSQFVVLIAGQHLAAPLILQFICGLTVTGTFNVGLHPPRRYQEPCARLQSSLNQKFTVWQHSRFATP